MFFFLLWPLFARAPRHWFLENFLLSAPGVQSVFLLRSKNNTTQGVFFFCSGPGERQGKEKRRWAPARGQSKKKIHPGFFFCCGPGERQGKEKPRWKPARGQSKKKNTTQGVFFLLRLRGKAGEGEAPLGAGASPSPAVPEAGAKKKHPGWCFFFCSGPVPAPNGASPSLAFRRGRSKKKHPGWCFFFCSGHVPAPNGASPSRAFRRGRSKKKYPGWCFFFAAAPRGRSLTHCGPGWRCLPFGGVVFFFLLRGGVFFCCGPARTLTHSRWAGAISARPGWCFFFAAAPPGLFRQ